MALAASDDPLIARWRELSPLLDEALELAPAELAAWLDRLRARDGELVDGLVRLLAQRDAPELATSVPSTVDAPSGPGDEPVAGAAVGPYRLVRQLGVGGMGSVWLAERNDGALKRQVALKLPRVAWGGAFAERLRRERDIVAALEHPHIARLYDAGADAAGRPYLAMEYVDGLPIDAWCREHGASLRVRVGLLLQVAAAVGHAHARLVVHRDLKPANILVAADGSVRLLDFGVAKLMEGDRTQETALTQLSGRALTLDYASPEQIRGEPLGTASDVYSLAVVAYELLAGRRPYRLKRGTAAELEAAIESAEPALASDSTADGWRRHALRGDLDAILNRALKKRADDRYPSMAAFAADLQRWLDGLPVEAQPDRLGYRARKFVARHRWQVAAAAVVATTLLAGTAVSLWQARAARVQAARAEEVKRFVLSIFANADTAGGGDRTTTAPQLLDEARRRLESAPVADPAVQAELLVSIGSALVGQGEPAKAVPVLERALDLGTRVLGPASALAADARLALAEADLYLGHAAAARALLDDVERVAAASGDAVRHGNALRLQAWALEVEDKPPAATAKARQAVAVLEGDPRVELHLLLDAYNRLASELDRQRLPEALAVATKAVALERRMHVDRDTAGSLYARALLASAQSRYADLGVAPYLDLTRVWQAQRRLLGERHPNTLNSAVVLEGMARDRGDVALSLQLLRGVLDAEQADGTTAWRSQAVTRLRYAQALVAAHRYVEADDALGPLLARLDELPPDWRPLGRAVQAQALVRLGRLDRAGPLLDRLVADGPVENEARVNLIGERIVDALVVAGRAAPARTQLDPVLASRGRRQDKPSAFLIALDGRVALAQGDTARALPLLRRADETFAAAHPDGSPERAEAQMARAEAELAAGTADAALRASAQARSFWQAFDPRHPDAARAALWNARALAAMGREGDARVALAEARAVLADADQPVPPSLADALAPVRRAKRSAPRSSRRRRTSST